MMLKKISTDKYTHLAVRNVCMYVRAVIMCLLIVLSYKISQAQPQ